MIQFLMSDFLMAGFCGMIDYYKKAEGLRIINYGLRFICYLLQGRGCVYVGFD